MTNDQISIMNFGEGAPWVKQLLSSVTAEAIMKWGLAAGLTMYSLFALVIVKQVGIMAETFEDQANGVVKLFAWGHLIMAMVILGAGILFL